MTTFTRLWAMLTTAEKRSAAGLVGIMLVSMVLEMLGIGVIVPALGLMASDTAPELPRWASDTLARMGSPSREQLLLMGLVGLLGLYGVKSAFVLFATWRQARFVAALQNRIARTLFVAYLSQPWTFHLERNSAEMIRNINDVAPLASMFTVMLGSIAELLVVIGIMGLLVWHEPLGAIAVGTLMIGATYVLDRTTRFRLRHWGELSQHHQGQMFKHLYQGLGGAKDVKILGCEQEFIDQYAAHRSRQVHYGARQSFLAQLPRLWYELLAVAALSVLTAGMLWEGKSTRAMIPTLGLFAAAAFRMLPSVNRLALALQSLRYSSAALNTIHDELKLLPVAIPATSTRFTFARSIELDRVSYRYPSAHSAALDDVRITIPYGASVGIIGGSGAGKSTLVDVVLGLLVPTSGAVRVDGVDIATDVRGWQDIVGYVPQTIYLCDDSLRRNVAFGIPDDKIDDDAVRRAIEAAQLDDFVEQLPEGIGTTIGERGVRLSGGQRQRIGIARALYHDPDVLVLDEATSALDGATEASVMEAVNVLQGRKTLVIIAHRLTTIASCDLVYRLDHGRVSMSGTYAEVIGG